MKNVTRLDIHNHGREPFGIASGTVGERIWLQGSLPLFNHHLDGPFTMARIISLNSKEWEQGATIRLFGCNQRPFAEKLSKMLALFGRGDIAVIAANGHVSNYNHSEVEAFAYRDDESEPGWIGFYLYRNGGFVKRVGHQRYR